MTVLYGFQIIITIPSLVTIKVTLASYQKYICISLVINGLHHHSCTIISIPYPQQQSRKRGHNKILHKNMLKCYHFGTKNWKLLQQSIVPTGNKMSTVLHYHYSQNSLVKYWHKNLFEHFGII